MNPSIQRKINQIKNMAAHSSESAVHTPSINRSVDSLSNVIRSKKDADDFMAELEAIGKRIK
ncbi:hypothetical protein ACXZ1K_07660 [Pedobacter sp. PWIIR3]